MAKIALAGSIAAVVFLGFLLWQGYFTCNGDATGLRIGWVVHGSC